MKQTLFVAGIAIFALQCGKDVGTAAGAAAIPMSSGQSELKALLDAKATVVDVRTPGEFASGHHPRAVNIPVGQVQSRMAEFGDKAKPVVVYCASGGRSGYARQLLLAAGYQKVINAGGYSNLP